MQNWVYCIIITNGFSVISHYIYCCILQTLQRRKMSKQNEPVSKWRGKSVCTHLLPSINFWTLSYCSLINIRINIMINITFTMCLPSLSNTFHAKDTFVQLNKSFSEIIILLLWVKGWNFCNGSYIFIRNENSYWQQT